MELGGVEKGMGGGRGGAMSGGKGCRGGKKEQEVESGWRSGVVQFFVSQTEKICIYQKKAVTLRSVCYRTIYNFNVNSK